MALPDSILKVILSGGVSIVPPLVNASFTANPWQLIEGEEGEGLFNLFQSTGAPDALGLDNVYNVPYIKNLVRADVDWIASFAAEDEDFLSIPASTNRAGPISALSMIRSKPPLNVGLISHLFICLTLIPIASCPCSLSI